MTLLIFPGGTVWLIDCYITQANESEVHGYLAKVLGYGRNIQAFICTHRDADHMRGIKALHRAFPLGGIWDNGVVGTTTNSTEYVDYMDLRRQFKNGEIAVGAVDTINGVVVTWLNGQDRLMSDANDQSLVAKIDYSGSSALLAGDTSFRPWRDRIVRKYGHTLKSSILLAPHHGSLTFFDDPTDTQNYYTAHIQAIRPEMTILSVGPNVHGLPDPISLKLYDKYSTGSNNGHKVYSTESKGNMKLTFAAGGGWSLLVNQ